MIEANKSEPISALPTQSITLVVAWKRKKYAFGGNNSALTSNHSPRKGERRSGPVVAFFNIILSLQQPT